jgi:hypothetical protein
MPLLFCIWIRLFALKPGIRLWATGVVKHILLCFEPSFTILLWWRSLFFYDAAAASISFICAIFIIAVQHLLAGRCPA